MGYLAIKLMIQLKIKFGFIRQTGINRMLEEFVQIATNGLQIAEGGHYTTKL